MQVPPYQISAVIMGVVSSGMTWGDFGVSFFDARPGFSFILFWVFTLRRAAGDVSGDAVLVDCCVCTTLRGDAGVYYNLGSGAVVIVVVVVVYTVNQSVKFVQIMRWWGSNLIH